MHKINFIDSFFAAVIFNSSPFATTLDATSPQVVSQLVHTVWMKLKLKPSFQNHSKEKNGVPTCTWYIITSCSFFSKGSLELRLKSVNTWTILGMLIVYWPITLKFRNTQSIKVISRFFSFKVAVSFAYWLTYNDNTYGVTGGTFHILSFLGRRRISFALPRASLYRICHFGLTL